MFTTLSLVDTSFTSHNYHFVVVVMVRTLKIYSHSNFQVYYTDLLAIITMLRKRSPELTHPVTQGMCPLSNNSLIPPSLSLWHHHSPLHFYQFDVLRDHI